MGAVVVVGTTPRLTARYTRAADATGAYAAGDQIGDTVTAAGSVPILFPMPSVNGVQRSSGRISGARCVITPASGNLVITACDFDLLLFRPHTASIPFASGGYPGDNAALLISSAAQQELVGIFRFVNNAWRSPAGSVTVAGTNGYQSQPLYSPVATPRPYAPFNVDGLTYIGLLGLLQAQGTWTPGNVAQQFDIALDVDLDQ